MVQIWYPAAEKQGDPEPYIRNINELSKGLEKHCLFLHLHSATWNW